MNFYSCSTGELIDTTNACVSNGNLVFAILSVAWDVSFTAEYQSACTENNSTSALINNSNKIVVYPNPFKDFVLLKLHAGKYFINIADTKGKQVFADAVNAAGGDAKLSLPDLATGVYYISIKDENEKTIYTGKLLKQ